MVCTFECVWGLWFTFEMYLKVWIRSTFYSAKLWYIKCSTHTLYQCVLSMDWVLRWKPSVKPQHLHVLFHHVISCKSFYFFKAYLSCSLRRAPTSPHRGALTLNILVLHLYCSHCHHSCRVSFFHLILDYLFLFYGVKKFYLAFKTQTVSLL